MVTMISQPLDSSLASMSGTGTQSSTFAAAPQTVTPVPAPPRASKPAENPKPVKKNVVSVRPKPIETKPPEPETAPQNHSEPAPLPESPIQPATAPENPQTKTGTTSTGTGTSGLISESSENENHSGGSTGTQLEQRTGTGVSSGSGMGSGSVECAFGSTGGPGFIQRTLPCFPRRAKALGKEGTVMLRLSLDETGRLSAVEIISGAGNGFDEEAVRAIQKSTFSPAVRNGRPVSCLALLSVQFQLESKQ